MCGSSLAVTSSGSTASFGRIKANVVPQFVLDFIGINLALELLDGCPVVSILPGTTGDASQQQPLLSGTAMVRRVSVACEAQQGMTDSWRTAAGASAR